MISHPRFSARAAAAAIFFGNGFGIGTWAAQLPRFKDALSLSDGQISFALLAFGLGAVVLMPVVGWLSGLLGSRTTVLAAAFGFAVTLFLPGIAPNLPLLIVASLLAGACNGAMDVSMNTNAAAVEREWGSPIMSSFHAFFSLGGLLGATASGLMIKADLGVVATLAVSCSAMALLFLAASARVLHEGKAEEGHAFAWPRGAILGLAIMTLMCFLIEGALVDWSAIYLQTVAGASLDMAAAGFAAFSLTMTACRLLGDAVVHKFGRVRTIVMGAALAGCGLALALALPTPSVVILGFAIMGLGLANVVPVLFSAATQVKGIPPGIGVAMVATFGYAGLLFGPPFIGFGGDAVGLRAALSVLVLLALAVMLMARRVVSSFA
ncbi:MFS transporter [Microvirga pudoricolor]|uniref:MFS transporter n=1 Tax=Microvirga pudoricolor TaxID=2778729 RepID=UPI00194DDD26|nr:MFS transporter [Microvirga pudoricolor]MBM6596005.1 MFS transporter [Microvirga pudoricolor]